MSYFRSMTNLFANTKSYEEMEALENLFSVINQMIDEKVKKAIADHREELIIDIKTMLNGKMVDIPAIKDEINKQIIKGLSNSI